MEPDLKLDLYLHELPFGAVTRKGAVSWPCRVCAEIVDTANARWSGEKGVGKRFSGIPCICGATYTLQTRTAEIAA